jgi:hypothetical protein
VPHDIVIELWHNGSHWALKKSAHEYWHKGKGDPEWKAGLPPGMKPQDVARAFRSG